MTDEVINDPQAVLAALDRAKADAKRYREQAEALQADLQQAQDAKVATEADVKAWEDKATQWAEKAKQALVRATLPANGDRIMKHIDLSAVTFDDEGTLTGVEEAVNAVKADLPELFDPKRRVGGKIEMFPEGDANHVKSVSELQAERLLRR